MPEDLMVAGEVIKWHGNSLKHTKMEMSVNKLSSPSMIHGKVLPLTKPIREWEVTPYRTVSFH